MKCGMASGTVSHVQIVSFLGSPMKFQIEVHFAPTCPHARAVRVPPPISRRRVAGPALKLANSLIAHFLFLSAFSGYRVTQTRSVTLINEHGIHKPSHVTHISLVTRYLSVDPAADTEVRPLVITSPIEDKGQPVLGTATLNYS